VSQKKSHPSWAYFISGLCLFLAALLFLTQAAKAATPTYDPYADAVTSSSAGVVNADNAVGAPNSTTAQMVGINALLTLDMGSGEEGTQTLKVYFGQVNVLINISVDFLDANQNVITSRSTQLGANPDPSTQNFEYNWTNYGKAYRHVRLSSPQVAASLNVDAIEALGFIGSTPNQDTDGDGIPDRIERLNNTDPLVANAGGSGGGSGGSSAIIPAGSRGSFSSTGASAQINAPPAAKNDSDGDGMPNDWELAHGLNPNDRTDATKDPDNDGLNNLTEYQIGSDPQKADSDGDGMPDGWEQKHGLDVLKNDSSGDPDGDHLTNLGEYKHHTDPQKADDLYKVFGRLHNAAGKVSPWEWMIFAGLLAGAAAASLTATKSRKNINRREP
jgi:hypothetical protein